MARLSDDDFAALDQEMARDTANALGPLRRASGTQRNSETTAWLAAGDNLAEKAIAALDLGDDERARRLVDRIVALPVVDEDMPAGRMAVSLVLYNEIVDPFDDGDGRGVLDLPLRLLPTLDTAAADALRHALAALADYDLPSSMLKRIRTVVPLEQRLDPAFSGVPEEQLPAAILSTLRLVLRLRSDEG